MNGPLTNRINPWGPAGNPFAASILPPQPVFDSGWGEPEPAAATPLGHGGTAIPVAQGLTQRDEMRVVDQLTTASESEERNQLLREWIDLNQRIRAFLSAVTEERLDGLRVQLEDVEAQGRAAHDKWKACQSEVSLYQGRVNAHLEALSKAQMELKKTEADRPDPEEWPTKAELAKYNERLAEARAKAESVAAKHRELSENLAKAKGRAGIAKNELQELRTRRDQLQGQLGERPAGRPAPSVFGMTGTVGGI